MRNSLERLTFSQIGKQINLKNNKSIRKWLIERNITIHKLSSKCFVYKIDFDLQNEKPFVLSLRKNNPKNWREMYRAIMNDDSFYNLMMICIEQEPIQFPTTRVILKNKEDRKLYRELAA